MKHVVVGKGNLGVDIGLAAKKAGHEVHIFTPSEGFEWPESAPAIRVLQPDYLWITAGFGSVEQCKLNPGRAFQTHLSLPLELMADAPETTKIGLFSSDYVAEDGHMDDANKITTKPRSIYALSKMTMELAVKILPRPYVSVFRVCSLYGNHYPLRTFPGKLIKRYKDPCEVFLPQNFITPTATSWIAETIISSLPLLFSPAIPLFHNCASSGGTTVMNFGRKILGDKYEYNSRGMDWNRPAYSNIGCSFMQAPTWEQMWEANREAFLLSLRNPVGGELG